MKTARLLILLSIVFLSTKTYSQWELLSNPRTEWVDQPETEIEFVEENVIVYSAEYSPPNNYSDPAITIRRTVNDCNNWGGIYGVSGWGYGPHYQTEFPCPDTGYMSLYSWSHTLFSRWTQGQGWELLDYDRFAYFDFVDGSHGFGVNGSLLYSITNTAVNLVDTLPMPVGEDKMHFLNQQTGFIHNGGEPGKVFKTSDGGHNWTLVLIDSTHKIKDLCFVTDSLIYISAVNKLIYKSTDVGETWTSINTGLDNTPKISFYNHQSGLTFQGSKIFRTHDGGHTWNEEADLSENYDVSVLRYIKCVNDCTAYAYGWSYEDVEGFNKRKEMVFKNSTGLYTKVSEKEINAESVKIYPNPFMDVITIETRHASEIKIYSTNQTLLFSNSSVQNRLTIDMSPYPKGVYLVKLKSAKGISTKKILKL